MPAKEQFFRLGAWITLQALIVTQVLPAQAWAGQGSAERSALRVKAPREAPTAAGLEEALVTETAKGFATRVARVSGEVQVAQRALGRLVGKAVWNAATGAVGGFDPELDSAAPEDVASSAQVLGWMAEGLQWLGTHSAVPAVQRVRQRLQEQGRTELPVEFRANHAMTLDFSDPDRAVRVDVTVAAELGAGQHGEGRRILYGLGLFHEQALAAGYSAREAIHLTLGLYSRLSRKKREGDPDQEQEHLQKLLRAAFIDHGNTWALFLEGASFLPEDLQEFAQVDSLALEDRLDTERDTKARARITRVLNHRDRLASWLEGQLKIDLPYDRAEFRKALAIPNVDQRRKACHEVIRKFNEEVEQENARRVSETVRDSLPENMPYPRIVAGRASRAFGNQAGLAASSEYLLRTEEMVKSVQELTALSEGEALLAELQRLVQEAPPAVEQELEKAVERVKNLLADLGAGVDRARLLVLGPDDVMSATECQGALEHVRQNLEIFFHDAAQVIKEAQGRAVRANREGVGRRPRLPGEAVTTPFQQAQNALAAFEGGRAAFAPEGGLTAAVNHLEGTMESSRRFAAAFSVLMQRPSETGAENFKANELEEKPEQEEQLRKLVRLGGQNLYMSPSYDWVAEATDVIEAAPLFIYERTITVEGRPVTVFEVDQLGLEKTIRQMADYWAKNVDQAMETEHVALAREIVVQDHPELLSRSAELVRAGASAEAAHRRAIREAESREELAAEVGQVAAWIAREYDRRMEEIEELTEKRWLAKDFIDRVQAVRLGLIGDPKKPDYAQACRRCAAQARAAAEELKEEAERLAALALGRRRPTPSFHMLTTEAPGLVEGFVQVILEEEMALRNIIRARRLEKQVQRLVGDRKEKIRGEYEQRILALGRRVIREFGYDPLVTKRQAELDETEEQAVLRVVSDHLRIQQEVARLAVLAQVAQADAGAAYTFDPGHPDHPLVGQLLVNAQVRAECERRALDQVWQRNETDLSARVDLLQAQGKSKEQAVEEAIRESQLYLKELQEMTRWEARAEALAQLGRRHPDLHLEEEADRWYREHSDLAVTTARREVIAAHKLNHLKMDPRYAYSAGSLKETADGKLRPTGGRKRYHLIYAPSRVNLGKGERESVEVWPQWVGVWDPLAAESARQLYALLNYNPQIMTIAEAETHKVSENQWTAMVRAIRNVQAYFVGRLGFGDIEGLAYEINQRGGLPVAAVKERESYSAGPTAGYCIPKDLLFKLFVATLQDERKLKQVGLPQRLHAGVSRMMLALTATQDQFETTGEWERWAAGQLMSPEAIERYCGFGRDETKEAQGYFRRYVEMTGGIAIPHLTKLRDLLQRTGIPSPLLARGQDLYRVLLSNWAERKLTLPAEQVNRSIVFMLVRDMLRALDEARRLNPGVDIAPEGKENVHLFGTYKSDETEAPPGDVRFAVAMRVFMILSGFWKEVGLSLDEEGQMLARLLMVGFRPDSAEPEDQALVRYLAGQFTGGETFAPEHAALVEELKRQFPGRAPDLTVGNITVTVVPGISSKDLEEFSAETKELLGSAAARAQELLQAAGISVGQMKANADLRRAFPEEWVPLSDLPPEKQQALREKIGGGIHPMKLRVLGPGDNFLLDIQAQDAVVFSVTHPELMAINPAHLRDRMLTGLAGSALAAIDYVAQGRHRVWFDRDVMLWYAAGRGVDAEGRPILDWGQRDEKGRRAVYRAYGFGTQEYEPLLGDDLRGEVQRQEARARELYAAFKRVAEAPQQDLETAVQGFRGTFGEWLVRSEVKKEAAMAVKYEQQLLLNGRWKPRDRIIRKALVDITTGLPPEGFGEVEWLATGGIFLLNGAPQKQREEALRVIRRAQERMRGAVEAAGPSTGLGAGLEEDARVALLIEPQLTPAAIQAGERGGAGLSVKASEQVAAKAVMRSQALAIEAAREVALHARKEGFNAVQPIANAEQIPAALEAARENLRGIVSELQAPGPPADHTPAIHRRVGAILGATVRVLNRVAEELVTDPGERKRILGRVEALTRGRELDTKVWTEFGGTYEDAGILARLFDLAGTERRDLVAAAMELLYTALALEKTADFLALSPHQVDERLFWRALAGFFGETIDDHFHEYNPWAFDPKRGAAFADYYDKLGVLKPERREELYGLSWSHHRALYEYVRTLAFAKTGLRSLPAREQDALCGRVQMGADASADTLAVTGIGAGAPGRNEQLWRAYNQIREVAFLRNDEFEAPVVFEKFDPLDPSVLDAARRVNHVFLAPVGRTHYSRALMEPAGVGDNLIITRDGEMVTLPGAKGQVLQVRDGHFWLSHARYRRALIKFRGMTPAQADAQIAKDQKAGRITLKGIRVAARFTRPVVSGSVVAMHHHELVGQLTAVGYPYTDKSDVQYAFTYDKTEYPAAYNPAEETGVRLPPEVDWFREKTDQLPEGEAKEQIARLLREPVGETAPFAHEHRILVVKGAAESGARNFKRFDLFDRDGNWDEEAFKKAVDFIHEVSKGQNVTIQRAIIVTPIAWMDPAAVEAFVERQIRDWSVPVNLQRHPKSWVYGTLRAILSCGMPSNLEATDEGLFNPANWQVSHPISLSSLQVATNVGRGGTLEMLTPDLVRPEFRETFIRELEEAGRRAMAATARYAKRYWDEVYVPAYQQEHGEAPQELDAAGVPYWWPRYLMLDFLPEPVWVNGKGEEAPGARVVDVIPGDPAKGTPARFTLQDPEGNLFEGTIGRFIFWLLEPNVGIGLWPNYWRREEARERFLAEQEGRPVDPSRVGVSDRIVLGNYLAAGEAFLRAKFGDDYFGPSGPNRGGPGEPSAPGTPSGTPVEQAPPFEAAAAEIRAQGVEQIGPGEASMLLAEAGVAALGGREAMRERSPEEFLAAAEGWLSRPETAQEFPQGEGIGVSPGQVSGWLADPAYRSRVAELAVDRGLSGPMAPPVMILPEPLSPEAVRELLPHSRTFAVVTGTRALMNHHLYPWEVSRGGRPVNVVGVNRDWLTPDGRAQRLMVLDPRSGCFVECACAEPIRLTNVFLVELPRGDETGSHRRLDERLRKKGVKLVDTSENSKRADDKGWLREQMDMGSRVPSEVTVPQTMFISKGADASSYQKRVEYFARYSPNGLVIQPRSGTTEGQGVEWFDPTDTEGRLRHIQTLLAGGDVMVSTHRGNVTYLDPETGQSRPIVLRFNAAAGQVTSASAVVGPGGQRIASLGRRGEVLFLRDALSGLRGPGGAPVPVSAADWEGLREIAQRAARALGLPVVGLDMVLEVTQAGRLQAVVLEGNARPGLLIFGERPIFTEGEQVRSEAAAPAGDAFWKSLGIGESEPPAPDSAASAGPAAGLEEKATLAEWQEMLKNPVGSGFWAVLRKRYGGETKMLRDRLAAYRELVRGALAAGFDARDRVVIGVASVGRDRVKGGHTDSPGLGGKTANSATEEEILAVLQESDDGIVHLSNADPRFSPFTFPVEESRAEAADFVELKVKEAWSPALWQSYIQAGLAYLFSGHFRQAHPEAAQRIRDRFDPAAGMARGFRLHVASVGQLALPDIGGVSSSSALTGAFSVGLNALLDLGMTRQELAEVDFGEYLLGKSAGAADKTAQLYGQRGKVVVVGSFPERFIKTVDFPRDGLVVLMTESPIPRLSTPEGRRWLEANAGRLRGATVDQVAQWAEDTQKKRFGSAAYRRALLRLREVLRDPARRGAAGVTDEEAEAVERAFLSSEEYCEGGLLRELTLKTAGDSVGGGAERELPDLAGWGNRRRRYNLIYRLLRLVPEHEEVGGLDLMLRKSALYGLSEEERVSAYLMELEAAVEAERRGDEPGKRRHVARIIELVGLSQDGDRATVDYRNGFAPTPWASDPRNDVSEAAIDQWVARREELTNLPGGFERSIPDMDEIADEAKRRFGGRVAMRVAAAGMGGTMAIHVDTTQDEGILHQVVGWLEGLGWAVRKIRPGAATQIIVPPKKQAAAGMEEIGSVSLEIPVAPGSTQYGLQPLLAKAREDLKDWLEGTPLLAQDGKFALHEGAFFTIHGKQLDLGIRKPGWWRPHTVSLLELVKNSIDSFAGFADARRETFEGVITARLSRGSEGWVLELADNGGGIPEETLGKLFLQRDPGGELPSTLRMRRLGRDGIAFSGGFFGDDFLRWHSGRLEIDTRDARTGPHRLSYKPTPGPDKLTQIVPGDRGAPGTTVRWIFAGEALSPAGERVEEPTETLGGMEEALPGPLEAAAQEVRAASSPQRTFEPQWRGVSPEGGYSPHEPVLVTLTWSPAEAVEAEAVAAHVASGLPQIRPGAHVTWADHYVTVTVSQKKQAMRHELLTEERLRGKRVAILVGDSPTGDFLTQAQVEAEPFPIPFAQVLVHGPAAARPEGYPNLALAEAGGAGVDQLFGELLEAIERGQPYEQVPLLSTAVPAELLREPVRPEEVVIFTDVDATLMGRLDTFDESQEGVEGQTFRSARREALVKLAQAGMDFRINTGKAFQELTGGRVRTDEERITRPLVEALSRAGAEPEQVGYDGAVGVQRGRSSATGEVTWSRTFPPGVSGPLSDAEAAAIFRLALAGAQQATAGLEEVGVQALHEQRLPGDDASRESNVRIIAGPHISGLAIGAALERVRAADGTRAAQVVFVVEDAEQGALVERLVGPHVMVFSASDPEFGSVGAALAAAQQLFPDAEELGTQGPVTKSIQLLLHNLFGIEINVDVELKAWNTFINRATLAFQA